MKYKYNARTEGGELQAGFVEAGTREAAANILRGHNLFILSLEEAERVRWYDKISRFFGRVKINDLMLFTRQFAILLESKVPIGESLRALHHQTRKPLLKEAVLEISEDVDAGLSLSQALERQSAIFSEFYVNMIRPAEVTGRLEEATIFLADYLEKEAMWISRVRNALIYPVIVIILFLIVGGIMLVTVFPQIEPVFAEAGVELPLITKTFLALGSFILKWWLAMILVVVMLILLLIDYFQSREGKLVFDEIKIRIPLLGDLFKRIYVARFAESVSVLIKGGVPLTQSLEIAGHAISNVAYAEALHEIAEGVKGGQLLSSLLSEKEYYFPALVGQLVATGEGAGRLDEVLGRISNLYTREINDILNNLVELLQPLLISVIGLFVGLLFASILLPIYNLAKAF
jgi:type IV pilus assembly protein PilC